MEIGSIFSWADNYDMYIASPNGIKATHAVVMSSACTPPASSRQGTLTDAADYPSTEETLVILSATDPPGNIAWRAVAQLVERRTRNRENPGSNPLCYRFEVWAFSFTSRRLSRLSCINEYLAIDSGGNVIE